MSNLANKCLVTRLKNQVENNNLPILGEIQVIVSLPANQRVGIVIGKSSGTGCVLSTRTEGVKFSSSASGELTDTYPLPDSATSIQTIFVDNSSNEVKKAIICISNKYILNNVIFNSSAITAGARIYTETYIGESSDWLNITNLRSADSNSNPLIGTVLDLVGMYDATTISVDEQNDVTTDAYANFTKLTNISLTSKVSGDIIKLGKLTAATNFAFGNSKCSGTIESWVQAQRANGRTTGSVTGNSGNSSNVTFNGSTANAKGSVSWTATTITMNGITIDA